eukprot:CAMPEP_0119377042 /NCGR_PEP_ID=MMETSP1334-20130426/42781_1 /TAXON_ID=127549 /ORGANISM="Calcidiscus leptoporus, Strain RCC1130" /LENGTH=43 /DNA_ID= /DNA_START= /DNA_END= /DNA_ORIENTATION=
MPRALRHCAHSRHATAAPPAATAAVRHVSPNRNVSACRLTPAP